MTDASSLPSLRTTLRFPFHSPDWGNRLLTGMAFSLAGMFVPILPGIVVYGYIIRLLRQTAKGEPLALPSWDNWSELLGDGLRGMGISLVYVGPSLIIFFGGILFYFVALFGGITILDNMPPRDIPPLFPLLLVFGAMGVMFLSMALSWLLGLLGALPLPLALAHFAAENRFSAAFDVRAWSRLIRADPWGFAACWVVVLGLGGLLYLVFMLLYFSIILCFIAYFVLLPLSFYLMLVYAALFGQFYRDNR